MTYGQREVTTSLTKLEYADLKAEWTRIQKTIKVVAELISAASVILLIEGQIRPLKWYNIKAWWKIANLSYGAIIALIEIWK